MLMKRRHFTTLLGGGLLLPGFAALAETGLPWNLIKTPNFATSPFHLGISSALSFIHIYRRRRIPICPSRRTALLL